MDPVTLSLTAHAVGAASTLKDEAALAVKAAYALVKTLAARPK
jgi:hypothetical protein